MNQANGQRQYRRLSTGLILLWGFALVSLGLATVVGKQILDKQASLQTLTQSWMAEHTGTAAERQSRATGATTTASPSDQQPLLALIERLGDKGQQVFQVQDELQELYQLAIWPAVLIILGVTTGLLYMVWQNGMLIRTQQKLNTERARSSQAGELLREAVDTAPDGFIVFNENDEIVLRNDGVDQVYGRFAEAIQVGNSFEDIVTHGLATGLYRDVKEDPAERRQFFEDRVRTHRAGQGEFMYHGTDDRWVRVIERRSESGYIVSVATELTRMKETEAALRTSEARYRGMLEDQHEFIVRFMPDLSVSFANVSYLSHLNLTEQALAGMRIHDLFDPDSLASFSAATALLSPTNPTQSCEIQINHDDGAPRWEQWTQRAIFDEDGALTEVQAIGRDITAEKLATQALENTAKQFREIADSHPVPVLLVRMSDWQIMHANQASIPLLGRDLSDLTGHQMLDMFASPSNARRFVDTLVQGGNIDGLETELVTVPGRRFTAEIAARRAGFGEEPIAAISIIDVTERLAAVAEITRQRNALAQSEKLSALGSLLASVSHELNNPLAVVLGQAQLLQDLAEDEAVKHRAGKIATAAQRSARIVKTFLAMVRQQPLTRRPVCLNDVVADALEIAAYALKTSGIETRLELDPELKMINADPDQIIQVAMNLIINVQQALEGTTGNRELTIKTHNLSSSRVVLSVADNGPGIAPELRERVFDSFFTTKTEGLGTGIGLSVCSNIVRAHGGQIRATEAPTGGAEFIVEFPAHRPDESAAATGSDRTESTVAAPSGARILVIDDEADIAATISDLLAHGGHDVQIVQSGDEGLALLQSARFDLVICDLRMPGMDGAMVYRHIEQSNLHPLDRIIFVTGDALSDHARDFLKTVQCPVIEKPFDAVEVRAKVTAMTAGQAS